MSARKDASNPLLDELCARRRHSTSRIEPMSWSESFAWRYGGEAITHATGRFFSVVGVACRENGGRRGRAIRRPILDQREPGTLGFLLRRAGAAVDILVQLKEEPGNVDGVQIAPTCQATRSNLDLAHGGKAPPGSDLFSPPGRPGSLLADSLQSEHGTRFFRKRNRNVALRWTAGAGVAIPGDHLVWTDARSLLSLLDRNFAVNTDARSVLVTMPWRELTPTEPFRRPGDPFAALLRRSYAAQTPGAALETTERVMTWLARLRDRSARGAAAVIPLRDVAGWRLTPRGVEGGPDAPFDIHHFRVAIPGREQEQWDQPLVRSRGAGFVTLYAWRRAGSVRFLFRAAAEAGLYNAVELHPTVVRRSGDAPVPEADPWAGEPPGETVLQVRQSEEGGRFFRDVSLYRVVLLHASDLAVPAGGVVLTPREIEGLAPRGAFTSEARSVISLLLSRL